MAFPTVINQAVTANSSTTSHVLTMPASIVAGRLLLCFLLQNGQSSQGGFTGWTALFAGMNNSSTYLRAYVKVAAGSDTATVTNTSAQNSSAVTYQVDSWSGVLANVAFATAATVSDPPSLTPAGGSADYLWFAAAASFSGTATAAPTNYTNLQAFSASANPLGGVAQRALTAATENPGTFTGISTSFADSCTIAVPPVPSASGVGLLRTPYVPRMRSFNW